MAVEATEEQRTEVLQTYFAKGNKPLRPILTFLNGDNAWLLSCPRPAAERETTGKAYYHIAVDPWLSGPAYVIASWFLLMQLRTPAAVPDVKALGAVVAQIEQLASGASTGSDDGSRSAIDAIFISNSSYDHYNEATLKQFSTDVPVFAVANVAADITKWQHFKTVVAIKEFNPATESWRSAHPGAPLPDWLTVTYLPGHLPSAFGLAIILSSRPQPGSNAAAAATAATEETHELITFAPHGILPTQPHFAYLAASPSPPVQSIAIMHTMKEVWTLGAKVNLGVANALALQRTARAKYYINTQGAELVLTGVFKLVHKEKYRTVEWGLEEEKKITGKEREEAPYPVEVPNGGCFVLE